MAKTAKRINRRKLVTVQAYAIISLFILFGMVIGLVIVRLERATTIWRKRFCLTLACLISISTRG